MNWQHVNILAATNYLRERIASGVPDARAREVYDGLLDVLDPSRIEKRMRAVPAAAAPALDRVPAAPAASLEAPAEKTAPKKAARPARRPTKRRRK